MVITTYKAYFVINFKSYPPFTPSPSKKKSQLRKFGLEIVKKKQKTRKCVHKSIKKWKLVIEISRI